MGSNDSRIKIALNQLQTALEQYRESDLAPNLRLLLLTKAFEVLVEEGWKELKRIIEDEGNSADSPKESVREAAKLDLIGDPELWIKAINSRNLSVHNYYALSEKDFAALAKDFLAEAKAVFIKNKKTKK